MAEYRGFDFLDYIVFLAKRKRILLITLISSFVMSYITIYFFIPPEFESSALIIPSGDSQMGALSGIMKNLKDLPLGLGSTSKSADTDLYLTIIYSRSTLELLIKKFNLKDDYGLNSLEKTIKVVKKKIVADVTDENALAISVRAHSPKKAADMVNYLLDILNKTIIKLNVSKSKDNREFLEKRYEEIKFNLKLAEDSLENFQMKSGMFEVKEQPKLILTSLSELESEVYKKQVELSIMQKISEEESPQIKLLKTQLNEYQNKLNDIKNKGGNESLMLPMRSLPEKTKNYLRLFRDVEIYNAILEFVIPLYEQAKFEEQKNIPVLQIIDYGRVPEKKVFPPRVLFAAVFSLAIILILSSVLIIKEKLSNSKNSRILLLRNELLFFKQNND